MRLLTRLCILAALVLLASTSVSPALGEDVEPVNGSVPEEVHEEVHAGAHEFHRNWAAVFLGVTSEDRRGSEPALGIEYARHLSEAFAIGGIVEYTFGDDEFWVVAVPFAYRIGPWKFYVAPGFEVAELKDRPRNGELLLRIGGEYAFEIGKLEIAPQIDVDFVDSETVFVVGVTLGTSF